MYKCNGPVDESSHDVLACEVKSIELPDKPLNCFVVHVQNSSETNEYYEFGLPLSV